MRVPAKICPRRLKSAPLRRRPNSARIRGSALAGLKYYATADDGGEHFCPVDCVRIDLEEILRDDDQVCELAGFERAFRFFAKPGVRGVESIAANSLGDGQPLRRDKAAFGLAFGGLPGDGGLDSFPGIQRNDGPVAAEGVSAAVIGDAFPNPGARSAIGTKMGRPDAKGVLDRKSTRL